MGALARTKLSTRMQLLVGLTLVGLLVLCVTALFQLKETMLDDRKEKVHNIVEVGLGIITHHHKLFRSAHCTLEIAMHSRDHI